MFHNNLKPIFLFVDMETLLLGLFCIFATLICAVILLPYWIGAAKSRGITGADMNKFDKRQVAEGGGIAVILAIVFGISLLIFIKSFVLHTETNLILILGVLATVLLAGFLGFIDNILGWKKGFKAIYKIILATPIALPLMVINVDRSIIDIPLFGSVDFGILYPLFLVPIAIIGASNGFNLVAGYNGLEAGLGAIILGSLGLVSWFNGLNWLALVCFISVAALVGFLLFNFYPARVFPGDALTMPIGALIAAVAILGNMEKLALMMFALYFVDIALYWGRAVWQGRKDAEAFGKVNPDNSLDLPYKKWYDSTHVFLSLLKKIKGKVFERELVLSMWFVQAVICIVAMLFVW